MTSTEDTRMTYQVRLIGNSRTTNVEIKANSEQEVRRRARRIADLLMISRRSGRGIRIEVTGKVGA